MTLHPRAALPIVLAITLLAPAGVQAQRHPRYLQARADLRRAQILMKISDEPNVMRDMQTANGLVERVIRELDAAAMFARRDIDDNPRVDTRMGRGNRFREIVQLLDSARKDISQEADNPRAAQWRNRAFGWIDQATDVVRKGGYDKFSDETAGIAQPIEPPRQPAVYPRYLNAIADLRYARALLYRPDWRDVMRDQKSAVEEIDKAIGEAKRAAIDDGKNPDAHPPIDRELGWGDRFRKAVELLDLATGDLSVEGDTRNAAAWRYAALHDVQNAKDFVLKAMRASWWR